MNLNQQQQIESYLAGEMNPEEISAFESLLEVNPELRQELNFQSEVISGIGEFRKTQLLARLNGLNVSSGWWSVIQHSSVLQYVSGAIAMVGIGVMAYWFGSSPEKLSVADSSPTIYIDAPELEEFNWNFSEILPLAFEEEDATTMISGGTVEVKTGDQRNDTKEDEIFIPVVDVPSAGDIEAEKDFEPQEAPQPEEIASKVDKALEVEVVESEKSDIEYKYYEGKLFLYGQFKNEPYQILEINSSKGRRIYLHHIDSFYQIVQTDRPAKLTPVTNRKLIQELSILQKSN